MEFIEHEVRREIQRDLKHKILRKWIVQVSQRAAVLQKLEANHLSLTKRVFRSLKSYTITRHTKELCQLKIINHFLS